MVYKAGGINRLVKIWIILALLAPLELKLNLQVIYIVKTMHFQDCLNYILTDGSGWLVRWLDHAENKLISAQTIYSLDWLSWVWQYVGLQLKSMLIEFADSQVLFSILLESWTLVNSCFTVWTFSSWIPNSSKLQRCRLLVWNIV